MGRVKTVAASELATDDRALYERASTYGSFGSLLGAMANRPPIMRHTFELLLTLADEAVLAKRYLELALVTVSRLNECAYCVSHHAPKLTVAGVSAEAAENILDYENVPEFDDVDRLVVEYAIQVTNDANRVRDGMFERLRVHFDDAQITELTWRIALCGAFNRFNDVLQNDIEDDVIPLEIARKAG